MTINLDAIKARAEDAREDVPALLAEVERLRAERDRFEALAASRGDELDPDRHESIDSFLGVFYGDHVVIRDRASCLWLAWESENGDWYASRSRAEDDGAFSADDPWRPIGPEPIEHLPLPWLVWQPGYALASAGGE